MRFAAITGRLLSSAFATVLGVVAGLYAAARAARLAGSPRRGCKPHQATVRYSQGCTWAIPWL